jgi:hypothetical protein
MYRIKKNLPVKFEFPFKHGIDEERFRDFLRLMGGARGGERRQL